MVHGTSGKAGKCGFQTHTGLQTSHTGSWTPWSLSYLQENSHSVTWIHLYLGLDLSITLV